jgi:outer membrane protein TolC
MKRQAENLAYLERSFAAGQGMKAQVLMARSQMLKLQPDLLAAKRDALSARRMLNRPLGRSADDATVLDTNGLPELEARLAPSRDELLKEAVANRGDLKALKEAIGLQEDIISIYRANYLPNVFLRASAGVAGYSTDMNEAFKEAGKVRDNYSWSVGVGMQWNLFDGFEQSAKAGQSRAAVHSMQLKQSDLNRLVEIDVDKAVLDRMAADSSLAAAREGVAAATEARSLYESSFRQGSGALSDVLAAEDNQRLAELALVAAQLERTRAAAQIALVRGQNLIALSEEP